MAKFELMHSGRIIFPFSIVLLFCCNKVAAQVEVEVADHDSTYYESFVKGITTRFYFSQKFTSLELERSAAVSRFRYVPNTTLNFGIGVSYRSFTLNLGYGFGFLNPVDGKGKTRYLDLQSHLYGRRWTIDILGQFYKGYYLTPKGLGTGNPQDYYIRPDLAINLMGIAFYRLFNPAKFSYRAGLLQDERQKKSSGSLLAGAEIYYGIITADSSLVPNSLSNRYRQSGVRTLRFIKIGPGIGYAYTFVIKKKLFLTGSLTGNLSVDYSKQKGAGRTAEIIKLNPGYIYRFVAGYDKGDWNVNFSIVGNHLDVQAATSSDKYIITTGNYRLTFAKRLLPGPKLKRRLHPLEEILKRN